MRINEGIDQLDEPVMMKGTRLFSTGESQQFSAAVQEEVLLDVYVNGILTMKIGCSSTSLAHLVIGRLFTEGMVTSADEIDSVVICNSKMRADVTLQGRIADMTRTHTELVPSCCTNNRTLNDYFNRAESLKPLTPTPWDPNAVFTIAREFEKDNTGHACTWGVHSAYLTDTKGKVLCVAEDIGRHNAFDKVVGWGIENGVDLESCMLFTSGRVPTDMVTKAIRSRIPVLISNKVATDKTVSIARAFNLTLICAAYPDSFDVMSDSSESSATSNVSR